MYLNQNVDLEYLKFAAIHKSPFPYFGGKGLVAHEVWERMGNVASYYEPFLGGGAVLFLRPNLPGRETVNDINGFIANFFRAVGTNSEKVAHYADYPISEIDLLARHRWLISKSDFVKNMIDDPSWYDAKIAGWWVWGISQWIGGEWCKDIPGNQSPAKRPHLTNSMGIFRERRKPAGIKKYLKRIEWRLGKVLVCSGDWRRIMNAKHLERYDSVGVFLDPPYSHNVRNGKIYSDESGAVSTEVRNWCIENGKNPKFRIALCGYINEGHDELEALGWTKFCWATFGGYAMQSDGAGRENRLKEVIYFSPYCLGQKQTELFCS